MSNRTKYHDAATMEWMFAQLLSDEQLSEETLDDIRAYLVEAGNEGAKERALQKAVYGALRGGRGVWKRNYSNEIWARLAGTFGWRRQQGRSLFDAPSSGFGQQAEKPTERRVAARPVRRKSAWHRAGLRVAAVLIPATLIIGGISVWRNGLLSPQPTTMVAADFVPTTTVVATADSVRHITMADGTRVVLNRNSTLTYNDNRQSQLRGEAWFEVARDEARPFVVNSDYARITVLGTEFNMNTEGERSVLSLYKGIVRIDHMAGQSLLESGGKEFSIDHARGRWGRRAYEVRDFDSEKLPAWLERDREIQREKARNAILMQILPLSEIFDIVEQEYGVEIVGEEVIDLSRRYNFVLDEKGSLNNVMAALKYANGGFNYEIDGKTVTVSKTKKRSWSSI